MFQTRSLLWLMLFSGIVLHMMCVSNFYIAITAMVKQKPIIKNTVIRDAVCLHNFSKPNVTRTNLHTVPMTGEYEWTSEQKNLILGSTSWLMSIAKLFGGFLCKKYGGKVVFGYSKLVLAVLCIVTPVTADHLGYVWVVVIRILQGFAAGLSLTTAPFMLISKWVPPDERGKFASTMSGLYFGISFTNFVSGFVLDWLGWRAVFYVAGVIGLLWCLVWCYFVFDEPRIHPYISKEELTFIEKSIGAAVSKKQLPVPWIAILTSVPFLINTLCNFCHSWTFHTFVMYMPTYYREVHDMSGSKMGTFSSIPYLIETIFAIIFGAVTDYILCNKILSRNNTRKLAEFLNTVVAGALLMSLIYGGCNLVYILTLITLTVMLNGASLSGIAPNLIDMSPNFAAILNGIQGFLVGVSGFLVPILVGFIMGSEHGLDQWNQLFLLTGIINIVPGLLFFVFADSTVQSWNNEVVEKETDVDVKLLHEPGDSVENAKDTHGCNIVIK